jgi:hypothetical protein
MKQLKQQQAAKQKLRHHLQTNVESFAFEIRGMMNNVSPDNWNDKLRQIFDIRFSGSSLTELLTQQLLGHQTIHVTEEEMQLQKQIDDLMREKD